MGAGDVKLLGALGSIVGYKNIVLIFIYSTLAGFILGAVWIISKPERISFLITTGKVLPAVDKKEKIPYAIAILLGTVFYVMYGKVSLLGLDKWL
jgi:Flp pilus assembly protein protease CpaA